VFFVWLILHVGNDVLVLRIGLYHHSTFIFDAVWNQLMALKRADFFWSIWQVKLIDFEPFVHDSRAGLLYSLWISMWCEWTLRNFEWHFSRPMNSCPWQMVRGQLHHLFMTALFAVEVRQKGTSGNNTRVNSLSLSLCVLDRDRTP